jgi:hypothetical protein
MKDKNSLQLSIEKTKNDSEKEENKVRSLEY